jgi:hypothetical protein
MANLALVIATKLANIDFLVIVLKIYENLSFYGGKDTNKIIDKT